MRSTDRQEGASSKAGGRSLLVLSDMHLGSDIGDSPGEPPPARSRSVDEDLVALLDHYRDARGDAAAWELVINGDFIDFVGISLDAARAGPSTEPTAEERANGLGTAEDHACIKLARVAERHRDVFASLAAFVDAGHHLVVVSGNHDREFHWHRVQDDLLAILVASAGSARAAPEHAAEFLGRIRFASWFYWAEGVAYIEHGAQYDSFCACEHALTPLSPVDPRRLAAGFTEVLLRHVVHPIRAIRGCDHDRMGLLDYIALAARLGLRGGADLFRRYVVAIVELFRLRTASLGEAAAALREEHERRLSRFAEAVRIDLPRLRALVALQARPVTHSVRGILASLLVDELALALLSLGMLAVLALLGRHVNGLFAWAGGLVPPAWWLGHRYLSGTRHVDPQAELAARAGALARLFPSEFVVMGHTHVAVRALVDGGAATYVNTGSWSEDEGARPDAPITHRAARTHLVIRVGARGPEAELLAWSGAGPTRFRSA